MDKIYKPLTGDDIVKWIPEVNLMKYKEFKKYNYLPRLPIIVLYESKENFGHWVLIFKSPEGIEHFDSYGYKPDDEFSFIPESYKTPMSGQDNKYLLKLLLNRDDINYNQYKFQANGPYATCGRWAILRYLFRYLTINQFYRMIKKTAEQLDITFDQLVTLAI